MVEKSRTVPHIDLRLIKEGIAAPPPSGRRNKNPITEANANNRQGHGNKLQNSISSIISNWNEERDRRKEENKPQLPENCRRIILQIDPDAFDPDGFKTFGIEVISELEDGYIIGASVDLELSDCQKKISQFIQEDWGGNKIAEIWEFFEANNKLDLILSPELLKHWDKIKDSTIYTVDIGIACLGPKSKLSKSPKHKKDESDEKYFARVKKWIDKRNISCQEWDDFKWGRENEIIKFVSYYEGEIFRMMMEIFRKLLNCLIAFPAAFEFPGKDLKI